MTLQAPFPYYGGKRKWAPLIWDRLGDPRVYVEPFAGSAACLLARPGGAGPREVISDLDGGVCNFWRATAADPEEVARWANYPTIHQDLTARHRWLREWIAEHSARLSEDPEFFDARAAGWGVWGISIWIGSGWCSKKTKQFSRPHISSSGGRGVSTQRQIAPMPHMNSMGEGAEQTHERDLMAWFVAIRDRMHSVIVLNQSWQASLAPTVLQAQSEKGNQSVGVLMDPPYLTSDRNNLYRSDYDRSSDSAALESWEWSLEHGHNTRIAYCCHEGDFEVPDGWDAHTMKFDGFSREDRWLQRRDMVMFSPACLSGDAVSSRQLSLLEEQR